MTDIDYYDLLPPRIRRAVSTAPTLLECKDAVDALLNGTVTEEQILQWIDLAIKEDFYSKGLNEQGSPIHYDAWQSYLRRSSLRGNRS